MTIINHISREIFIFHGRMAPEPGTLIGYGAIIEAYDLPVPLPVRLSLISKKHRIYTTESWLVFTPRYQPEDTLYAHLVFALKYEGVNLLVFKKLFEKLEPGEIIAWIKNEPQSQYGRRIWFLYEWMMQGSLDIPDLKEGNYMPLLNERLQYASPAGPRSKRHRLKNNLPGNVDFCPLIFKTDKLERYIAEPLSLDIDRLIHGFHRDLLLRASAFLLLKDSRASFNIEGEQPTHIRALRWGKVIGQAGSHPLSADELARLQQIVIDDPRFIRMGYRTEGGFVGAHDRNTGDPIPDHISARWQDLDILIQGLTEAERKLEASYFHPVLIATMIAFGFVFIHPFEDGNGRIHRYLIHHILAATRFTPQGIIFPVSAAILDRMDDYRKVLESFSRPLLDFIEWKKTPKNNIEVINDTIDYYRYFDATKPAEFLFECIEYTIKKIIPEEVRYLQSYDEMKSWLDGRFQLPDRSVDLLIRFLSQNGGKLSKRAKGKEFAAFTADEIIEIEKQFQICFY
ncbi:MAG: Fic family protein [Bacteroidales bacterium]|nr:Fic family protein [Bacteroidales bacterium]